MATNRWTPEAREAQAARAREQRLANLGRAAQDLRPHQPQHSALAQAIASFITSTFNLETAST